MTAEKVCSTFFDEDKVTLKFWLSHNEKNVDTLSNSRFIIEALYQQKVRQNKR